MGKRAEMKTKLENDLKNNIILSYHRKIVYFMIIMMKTYDFIF